MHQERDSFPTDRKREEAARTKETTPTVRPRPHVPEPIPTVEDEAFLAQTDQIDAQGAGPAFSTPIISPIPASVRYEELSPAELKQIIERITRARIDTPLWIGGRLWIPLRDADADEEVRQALSAHGLIVFEGAQKIGKLSRKDQVRFIVCLPPSKAATRTNHRGQAGSEDGTRAQRIADSTSPMLRFRRRGNRIVVAPCEDMKTAIANTYKCLAPLIKDVRSIVRSYDGNISVEELSECFKNTELNKALDKDDWQLLINEFTKKRSAGSGNLTIGALARRTGLSLQSVATYLKPSKRRKKAMQE